VARRGGQSGRNRRGSSRGGYVNGDLPLRPKGEEAFVKTGNRLLTRHVLGVGVAAAVLGLGVLPVQAQTKSVTIGITLPLTGADAQSATLIMYGAQLAIDEANEKGAIPGYKIETMVLDSGTATAGQYDPAQAATNAKVLVANTQVVANVGPQMSGEGKAMSPILSSGNLATITPSSTNPDITDPKMAAQFRPNGKAVYFRTVTTDAFQGPNMANYYADTLKVKSVFVLDDSGAYGVGIANTFQKQAEARGIKILGRDQVNPKEADYTTILTKVKAANPDALYYGGVAQAGVKLVKQAYDVIPKMIKGGGDGVYGPEYLKGAGFPACEGWYATIAGPHLMDDPAAKEVIARFRAKYGTSPDNYSITAYDAALVIIDSINRVVASGKPVDRANVRDAIQAAKLKTFQGEVSFDDNGDIVSKVVSVFQLHKDAAHPEDDVEFQYKYMGVAPTSS
jgi:branched-chain amino acid transport system substrate-binding protein